MYKNNNKHLHSTYVPDILPCTLQIAIIFLPILRSEPIGRALPSTQYYSSHSLYLEFDYSVVHGEDFILKTLLFHVEKLLVKSQNLSKLWWTRIQEITQFNGDLEQLPDVLGDTHPIGGRLETRTSILTVHILLFHIHFLIWKVRHLLASNIFPDHLQHARH